jgi:hypothetical protein
MTTVSIFPVAGTGSTPEYYAVAGSRHSSGSTAGQALDALSSQLPAEELKTLVIVQHMKPDALFNEAQQRRMAELMQRWQQDRDGGVGLLSPAERVELEALVDAELKAAGDRAASIARRVGG